MPIQEVPDHLQFLIQRLGAELAQGVAEIELGRAARASPTPTRPATRSATRSARGGTCSATLLRSEPSARQIGPHPARGGVIHAEVNVDQQRPDPVVELARDAVTLIREVPARLVGGGERVVCAGEDDFVETALAEAGGAVAAPWRRPGALFRGRGAEQQERDESGE